MIDDLTLKREFIVFDLRCSRNDPLSIRVRWDTSLKSIQDQSKINPPLLSINVLSEIDQRSSKFSSYGQKAISEAKKNDSLIEFAHNFPPPKERKILLAEKVYAKNSEIWARYIFREAYSITDKDLGPEFTKFIELV